MTEDIINYVYEERAKDMPVRVQFALNKELIEKAISEGVPVKHIHEKLKSENKITCSYEAFNRYIKKITKKTIIQTPKEKEKHPFVKVFS